MKNSIETPLHMSAVALTMWLGSFCGVAHANVLQLNGWNSSGEGQFATFGNTASSSFNDLLTLPPPAYSFGNHSSNLDTLNSGGGASFSSMRLSDSNNLIGSGGYDHSSSSLGGLGGTTTNSYPFKMWESTKSVSGSNPGTVVVDPVPEPQTYAMLLIGFGLVALSARRRKSDIDQIGD